VLDTPAPETELKHIIASNETKKVKQYRKAFPHHFRRLYQNQMNVDVFYNTLIPVLSFIHAVRNNVFHGSKTKIQMEDSSQQERLLIYTAILVATNGLLFKATQHKDIGWRRPLVYFQQTHRLT
jgi:hypothetical protein